MCFLNYIQTKDDQHGTHGRPTSLVWRPSPDVYRETANRPARDYVHVRDRQVHVEQVGGVVCHVWQSDKVCHVSNM